MGKVCIWISIFQGWPKKVPGSYTLVADFLICQYADQYTSCILCETGGILAGLWKVCGRIPSMSGHMSVYIAYTGRIKGYTEGGVDGMCTDFVYLMDNGSGF